MAATSGAQELNQAISGLFDEIRSKSGAEGAMTFAQAAQAVASITGGADVLAIDLSGGTLGASEGLVEVGAGVYVAPASFTLGPPEAPGSMEGASFAGWLVEGAAEGAEADGSPLSDGLLPAEGAVAFSGLVDGAARLTAVWVSLSAPDKVYDGEPCEVSARIVPDLGEPALAWYSVSDGARTRFYGTPIRAGSYAVDAAWGCGAAASAELAIARRPVTARIELYLDGEPIEAGGSVVYGEGKVEARLAADNLAWCDRPSSIARILDRSAWSSYPALNVLKLETNVGITPNYVYLRDPDDPEAGEYRVGDEVAVVEYTVLPAPLDPSTPRGAEVVDLDPPRAEGGGYEFLYDRMTGSYVGGSMSFREALPAVAGSAGSVYFHGSGYTVGESIGSGMPESPGVYFAEIIATIYGGYSGTRLVPFTVGATDASELDARLAASSAVFDGGEVAPAVSVGLQDGTALEEGTAWFATWMRRRKGVSYDLSTVVEPGTYKAHVVMVGAYRGYVDLPFEVAARPLSDAAVSASAQGATRMCGMLTAPPTVSAACANASGSYQLASGDFSVAGYSASESGPFHETMDALNAALEESGGQVGDTAYVKLEAGSTGRFSGERVEPFAVEEVVDLGACTAKLYDPGTGDELTTTSTGMYQMQFVSRSYKHTPAMRIWLPDGSEAPSSAFTVTYKKNTLASTERSPSSAVAKPVDGSGYKGSLTVKFVILSTLEVHEA